MAENKLNKAIIVTGTPGTGKTTIARYIVDKLSKTHKYLDVKRFAKQKGLIESYDKQRKSHVIDEKKLAKALEKEIKTSKKPLVIDSHLSHFLRTNYVKLCIISTCSNLKQLKQRLTKRGYSKEKIRENLDVEIFQSILHEAKERKHVVLVEDTSKPWKNHLKNKLNFF